MAAADAKATSRFAVACGVLSHYVKAAATMPLTPASDVSNTSQEPNPPAGAAQLTIFYGGRVVVFDGCTPDRAAELIRLAAAGQGAPGGYPEVTADMPIARKVSLQRFLEKRKGRAAARGPYSRTAEAPAARTTDTEETREGSSWLALGRRCSDRLNLTIAL